MDKIRVLAVDDSPFSLEMIKAALNVPGIEVCAAAQDGQTAIKLYQELKPDFITMDITMPDMDGLSCSAQIISIDKHARIIIISSMRDEILQKNGLAIGIKAFLQKPVKADELINTIRHLAGHQPENLSGDIYTSTLLNAVQKNLFEMANLDCRIDFVSSPHSELSSLGIAIIIGITGGKKGRIMLDLSPTTARTLAEKIYGHGRLDDESVKNAVIEFFNISCGHCSSNINNTFPGEELRLTPPSIAIGREMILSGAASENFIAKINSDIGLMQIAVDLAGGDL